MGAASSRDYAIIAIKGILSIYSYHLEDRGFFRRAREGGHPVQSEPNFLDSCLRRNDGP